MRYPALLACGLLWVPGWTCQSQPAGGYSPVAGPAATVSKPVVEIEMEKQIDAGARATAALNHPEAIRILEDALRKIRSNPALKRLEPECLVRLGYAYLGPLRLDDAVRSFAPALDTASNCRPRMDAERCAEAQYGLGTAQMYQGDFPSAARNLGKAVASYRRAAAGEHPEEFQMNKVLQQAKVEGLLGAALFRTGDKPKAIETLRHSIQQLGIVQKNERISSGLRDTAQAALLDARKSLDMLQQN